MIKGDRILSLHDKYFSIHLGSRKAKDAYSGAYFPNKLATMPGDRCILQLWSLPPFYSRKYDLKQHSNFKYTAEALAYEEDILNYNDLDDPDDFT